MILARSDQTQALEAEIRHGARRRADVFGELRLDQDHDRSGGRDPALRLVGAGSRHDCCDLVAGPDVIASASAAHPDFPARAALAGPPLAGHKNAACTIPADPRIRAPASSPLSDAVSLSCAT